MKPFRFSLQAVMTIRVNEEKKALEAFSLAQAEWQKILARQRAIEQEIEQTHQARRKILTGAASSEDLQQIQHGVRALKDKWERCKAEVARAKAVVDEKSKILLAAKQKREVLDKLHEKQFAAYEAEVKRTEQKMLDEFATMRSSSVGLTPKRK